MNQDKVDLTSVNKEKKQFKLPKLKNPLKKQAGPNRDQEGKFTSGSGGLINTKNFNWKRAIPLMAVVALVGGFFVYRSFAGTSIAPRAYQYSINDCQKRVANKVDKTLSLCQGKSAEALTIRYYKGISNRSRPDAEGYKYWTQRLAGDRQKPSRVAEQMLVKNKESNATFVTNLYKNLLLRSPDASGKKYWNEQLNNGSWTKARVAATIATSPEAISKQSTNLASYLKVAPKVLVTQTARKKVESDTKYAKEQINGKTYYIVKGMQSRSKLNNDLKVAAGKVSDKPQSKITPADLDTIRTKYSAVIAGRLANFKGKDWQGAVKDNYNRVKERYDNAATVNKYSPDITFVGLSTELKVAQAHKNEAQRQVDNAQWLLNETNRALTIAQGKYNAERARLAAIEAAKCKSGPDYNGSAAGCGTPSPEKSPNCPSFWVSAGDTCVRLYVNSTSTRASMCSSGGTVRTTSTSRIVKYSSGDVYRYSCTDPEGGTAAFAPPASKVGCPENYYAKTEAQFQATHCRRAGY